MRDTDSATLNPTVRAPPLPPRQGACPLHPQPSRPRVCLRARAGQDGAPLVLAMLDLHVGGNAGAYALLAGQNACMVHGSETEGRTPMERSLKHAIHKAWEASQKRTEPIGQDVDTSSQDVPESKTAAVNKGWLVCDKPSTSPKPPTVPGR